MPTELICQGLGVVFDMFPYIDKCDGVEAVREPVGGFVEELFVCAYIGCIGKPLCKMRLHTCGGSACSEVLHAGT